jgi:hypothetical protein
MCLGHFVLCLSAHTNLTIIVQFNTTDARLLGRRARLVYISYNVYISRLLLSCVTLQVRGYWGDVLVSPYIAFGVCAPTEPSLFEVRQTQHVKTAVHVAEFNVEVRSALFLLFFCRFSYCFVVSFIALWLAGYVAQVAREDGCHVAEFNIEVRNCSHVTPTDLVYNNALAILRCRHFLLFLSLFCGCPGT